MKYKKQTMIFVSILILVSILTGFIFGLNNSLDLTDYITSLKSHNNLLIYHLFVILLFLFSTMSLIGIIMEIFYIGFESVSIGYIIALFYTNFKLKGILYSLFVILINKCLFIIMICYLLLVSFNYVRKSIHNIIGLYKDYLINIVKPLLQKYAIITFVILIYDGFIYFFGNSLLNYLTFML